MAGASTFDSYFSIFTPTKLLVLEVAGVAP